MMRKFLILGFILTFSIQISWAELEYHEDQPVIPGKLETLKSLLNKGVHVQKITHKFWGYRDNKSMAEVSKIEFELRYVFLNDKQKAEFQPWDEENLSVAMDELLDDWIYDNKIQVTSSMTREMVYSLTELAKEAFKDDPIYVIGFQPVKIEYPIFTVTEPGVVLADQSN